MLKAFLHNCRPSVIKRLRPAVKLDCCRGTSKFGATETRNSILKLKPVPGSSTQDSLQLKAVSMVNLAKRLAVTSLEVKLLPMA